MKKIRIIAVNIVVAAIFIVPLLVGAADGAGVVPCGNEDPNKCDFDQLIILIKQTFDEVVKLSIAVAALAFAIAGFYMMTAGGSDERLKRGKSIIWHTLIGILLILAAWLIVYTIMKALVKDSSVPIYLE